MRNINNIIDIVILIIPVVAILLYGLIFHLTPVPFSLLTRLAFLADPARKPKDYDHIHKNILCKKNIRYPSIYGRNQLDLYFPAKISRMVPLIFWIHGGGYVGGNKADLRYFAATLSYHGYSVVAVNYQLAPNAKYPAVFQQINEVYQFLLANKDVYPYDLEKIILAGDSAGGQIAAQIACALYNKKYGDSLSFSLQLPRSAIRCTLLYCGLFSAESLCDSSTSYSIKKFIKMIAWGYFGVKEWQKQGLGREIDILKHANQDFPPAFITDGNKMSFEIQARELTRILSEKNVPVKSLFFDPEKYITPHEYQFRQNLEPACICMRETLAFLEEHVTDREENEPVV